MKKPSVLSLIVLVPAIFGVICLSFIGVRFAKNYRQQSAAIREHNTSYGVSHSMSSSIMPLSLGLSNSQSDNEGYSIGVAPDIGTSHGVSYGENNCEERLKEFCNSLPSGYNFNVVFEGNGIIGWCSGTTGPDGDFDIEWNEAYESEDDEPYDIDTSEDYNDTEPVL